MRKIKTKKQLEKKQKRNQLFLGMAMVLLLLGSVAGFSLMSQNNDNVSKTEESGFEFIRENGLWKIAFGEDIFAFQNLPSEVKDIKVNINVTLGDYTEQTIYFINTDQGTSEILMNLDKYILRYQEACLPETNCTGNLPEKDCSNNLIIFETGNKTEVYSDENCIYIIGDSIKGADAFLYKILGIRL